MSRSKAAVVLILDVGYSELLPPEKGEKFVEISRECVSMAIQSKIFISEKDEVSLILMGCNSCKNHNGERLNNIKIVYPLGPPTWAVVRKLKRDCTGYCKANWVEAVNMALRHLRINPGKFVERRIVIFTSNLKLGSLSNLSILECGIQDQVVDLLLVHPMKSDDPEMAELNSEIEEAENITKRVEGNTYDIEGAADQLLSFKKKTVKPQPWNVCLDIGSNIGISVTGYKKVNESQNLKWGSCLSLDAVPAVFPGRVAASSHEISHVAATSAENLPGTSERVSRMNVTFRFDGTKVDPTETIECYSFGSSMVPFSDTDKNAMRYISGEKCLSVVKITKKMLVPRNFWLGKSSYCFVARDGDEDAAIAFSALVQALDHMESVAIVRRVYNRGNKPQMGALFPIIKATKEYLVYVELPFSNYLRKCILPELKVNRLSAQQFEVIDQLIDDMDLSAPKDDDNESLVDRQWSDLLVPHKVCNPYLQYVRKCVAHRILNPGEPLCSIDPDVYKMLTEPPQPIKESIAETLDQISQLFPNLEPEYDPHKKGRGKRSNTAKVADDGNPDAEDGEQPDKLSKIEMDESEIKKEIEESNIVGISTPVEDFKAAVELKDVPFIKVCKQMQEVIVKLVLNSFGLDDFEKPEYSLRTLRNAVITQKMDKSNSVACFNSWMKDVYELLQEKFKMGFWNLVTQENLGFITCEECSESSLSAADVNEILGIGGSLSQTLSDDDEMDMPIDM